MDNEFAGRGLELLGGNGSEVRDEVGEREEVDSLGSVVVQESWGW